MTIPVIGSIIEAGLKILDKVIPDPNAKAQAQLELLKMQQQGAFQEVELQLKAIVAEANSPDPWTSRARPSFLYVIYVMLLAGIPMGILSAFRPDLASSIATGYGAWLKAIPDELYMLFGAGYLGYTGMRGLEKWKGGAK